MVRVRFAARPAEASRITHMRTALINWLLARSTGGQFVFRVEDADSAHREAGAVDRLAENLRWLRLDWDEGPVVGGPFGPYFQAGRLSTYYEHVERLLATSRAYRCYCGSERQGHGRAERGTRGHSRRSCGCRQLPPLEWEGEEGRGTAPVVRFKTPRAGQTVFHDVLRGELSFANCDLEDEILLKSDGYPTPLLADAVDDRLMNITHVLRGDDWIPSTPHYVLLYEAFGWNLPQFAHLPPVVDASCVEPGRQFESLSLDELRQLGYLPQAVANCLALLGWAPPEVGTEVYSLEDLARLFSLDRLSTSPPVFDRDRLDRLNRQHLRRLSLPELSALTEPFLQEAFGRVSCHQGTVFSETAWRETFVRAASEEMVTLRDVVALGQPIFGNHLSWTSEAREAAEQPFSLEVLAALSGDLPAVEPFDYDTVNGYLRSLRARFKAERGLAGREVMFTIRACLTGTLTGPCLVVAMILLGKARCMARIAPSAS